MEKEAEEDSQYRQQLEQERRDHELALRLAEETNGQVDDSPMLMRKYVDSLYFICANLIDRTIFPCKAHFVDLRLFV